MMKKALHIIFLSLFFLLGLQCAAGNKKSSLLLQFKIENCNKLTSTSTFSKQEKNTFVSSIDKLHKKKKISKTCHNAIASVSKCKGFVVFSGTSSPSKFLVLENKKHLQGFSDYTFHNSFCHRKLLSIIYSFHSFW